MAAIGRGRSLKNLRIRGKPACRPRSPHPGPAARRGARLCSGPGVGEASRASGAAGLRWFLTGVVCLFRTGRNDSGEENVPLDLTRGNAGRRGRRGDGGRSAGAGRARHATRGTPRGRARRPSPCPEPVSPRLSPSGPRAAAGARERGADLGAARDPELPGRPRECVCPLSVRSGSPRIPGAALDVGGGRGCYLGYWRMFVGRATTSCPPRPPEQMLDPPASCRLRDCSSRSSLGGPPQPGELGGETESPGSLRRVRFVPRLPAASPSRARRGCCWLGPPPHSAAGSLCTFRLQWRWVCLQTLAGSAGRARRVFFKNRIRRAIGIFFLPSPATGLVYIPPYLAEALQVLCQILFSSSVNRSWSTGSGHTPQC